MSGDEGSKSTAPRKKGAGNRGFVAPEEEWLAQDSRGKRSALSPFSLLWMARQKPETPRTPPVCEHSPRPACLEGNVSSTSHTSPLETAELRETWPCISHWLHDSPHILLLSPHSVFNGKKAEPMRVNLYYDTVSLEIWGLILGTKSIILATLLELVTIC